METILFNDGHVIFWEGSGTYLSKNTRTTFKKWFKLPDGKTVKKDILTMVLIEKPVSDINIALELSELCY